MASPGLASPTLPAMSPAHYAVALATSFLTRVWGPTHDLDAIDEPMTEDYRIWFGGVLVEGREATFTGITMWRVRVGRPAECCVERASFESYLRLRA
jgi:hypothetical protein